MIGEEHYYLDKHDRNEERRELEVLKVRRDRERHNATCEKPPCQGVHDLHCAQGVRNGSLILANHAV